MPPIITIKRFDVGQGDFIPKIARSGSRNIRKLFLSSLTIAGHSEAPPQARAKLGGSERAASRSVIGDSPGKVGVATYNLIRGTTDGPMT